MTEVTVTVSPELIDKAQAALNSSAFWEFADCPVTIRIAMLQAEMNGERVGNAARRTARLMLKRVRDPMARMFVSDIAKASNVEKQLTVFEAYRDKIITKVAGEFVEAGKADSVQEYRLKRSQRVAFTGYPIGKSTFAEMSAA